MYERTTTQGTPSIPTWETLHVWLRGQVQGLIQRVLEEEVWEFLGRERYQRRAEVGGAQGYRNGYGKPRKLSTLMRGGGGPAAAGAGASWSGL